MVSVIIGGSGSGKSAYAEQLLENLSDVTDKYYLATMQVYDKDGADRVQRHRQSRKGKGFITVEQPRDIAQAVSKMRKSENAVLLECMSNLVANEMFAETVYPADYVMDKVLRDVEHMKDCAKHLIIVTNNVFEDGCIYDAGSTEYMEALAEINIELVRWADEFVEVVSGLPVRLKGGNLSK